MLQTQHSTVTQSSTKLDLDSLRFESRKTPTKVGVFFIPKIHYNFACITFNLTSMNKKLTIILIATLFMFAACNSKWQKPLPADTPKEYIEKQEQLIEKNIEALDKDPKDTEAAFEVAFAYQQLNEFKKAIKYYEKVLEGAPVHFPALNNLADIYEQVEEYELAAKYIKKLYESNETDNEVIQDTVRILLKNNEPVQAQQALENFARKTKDTVTPEQTQMISQLYESIQIYKQEHEKTN